MMIYHVQSGFYYTRNTYIKACYYNEYIVMKKKKKECDYD